MAKRILSGVIAAAILVVILLFADSWLIQVCIGAVSVGALWEWSKAVHVHRHPMLIAAGMIASAVFTYALTMDSVWLLPLLMLYMMALAALTVFLHKKIVLSDITKIFFGTVYITFMLGAIVLVRMADKGQYLIWLIFITAFLTDTFAYFAGKFFGKRKLCPRLSPRKTIAGSIGGVFGSVLFCCIFGVIMQLMGMKPDYFLLVLLGVVGSFAAQCGDLFASAIKRHYGIKDFGNIMPGHGGILDRIDSVLLTAPVVYIFVILFPTLLV